MKFLVKTRTVRTIRKPILEWTRESEFVSTALCAGEMLRVFQDGDKESEFCGMWCAYQFSYYATEEQAQLACERKIKKRAEAILRALKKNHENE